MFSNFLILYYLLYIKLYSFYFIEYLIIILRPFRNILLFNRYLILYNLRVEVLSSTKILLE